MSANATPIVIAETVIGFKATPNSAGIAPILKSLSSNAAHNARCIVGVQNEVEGLREMIATLEERINRHHGQTLDLGKTMETKFAAQAAIIDTVAEQSAKKADVATKVAALWKEVTIATRFVKQVESNSCDSLLELTRTYIEQFLPVWYEQTSQDTLSVVRKIVTDAQAATHQLIDTKITESDQRSTQNTANVQSILFGNMCQMNDDRRRDIHRQRVEIDETVRALEASLQHQLYEHALHTQKNHTEACNRLLVLEESCRALRSTLCLDDALARELHNQHIQRTRQHANFTVISMNADTITVDKPLEHIEVLDGPDDHAAESVALSASSSGSFTPRKNAVGSTALSASPSGAMGETPRKRRVRVPDRESHTLEFHKTNPLDNIGDQRVIRVAQSPHFFALRTSLMRDITERTDMIRSDLHNDMISEIFDLQRELKGKVGNTKVAELLVQHRDQTLYTNVKNLIGDVGELRSVKVDQTTFLESLRSKVDHRMIEGKIDKATVVTMNEQLLIRLEELSKSMQRVDTRLQSNEMSVGAITRQMRGGGGVGGEMNPFRKSQTFNPSDFANSARAGEGGGPGGGGSDGTGFSPRRSSTCAGESEVASDRRNMIRDFAHPATGGRGSPSSSSNYLGTTDVPLVVVGANGQERPPTGRVDGVSPRNTTKAGGSATPRSNGKEGRTAGGSASSAAAGSGVHGRPTLKQQQERSAVMGASGGGGSGVRLPASAGPGFGGSSSPPPGARLPISISPRPDSGGGSGLIPLTKFQQAYCEAIDADPRVLQRAVPDKFSSQHVTIEEK